MNLPTGADVVPWLGIFVAFVVLQRLSELALSARNARRLAVRGARRLQVDGFAPLVAVHVLFPLALIAEVLLGGARPGVAWPWWLGLWLVAQGLRYAAVRALGERWNVRVIVVPDAPQIRRGPYRILRHPNYAAVAIELIAAPMMFGAWRTMIALSILNALAVMRRIRLEERALAPPLLDELEAKH